MFTIAGFFLGVYASACVKLINRFGGSSMNITLKDIARIVGVAESTVSRALNDKGGVSQEKKIKILKIAKKFNYRPNQLARGLAAKRSNMIAVILSDFNDPGKIEIVKKIEKEAAEKNYQIILCNTNNDQEKEKFYLSLLESDQVDGAIFIGGGLVSSQLLHASFSKENAIVLINRLAEENLFSSVLTDYSAGTYKAVNHLISEGYKKIFLISSDKNILAAEEKQQGYKKAMNDAGLEFNNDYIFHIEDSRKGGYNCFLDIINRSVLPEAFVSTKELTTVGLVEAIKTGGYFIPNDFAVIGYGNNILTSVIEPPLTVLSEPIDALAETALNFLFEIINDNSSRKEIKVLSPKLIIRESSKLKYNLY